MEGAIPGAVDHDRADEVREQVLERCEIFSKDGGFVFDAIHNVQAKTPVENIVAMIDEARSPV